MDMTTQPPATRERIDLPGGWSFRQIYEWHSGHYALFDPKGDKQTHGFTPEQARSFAAAMAPPPPPPPDPAIRATAIAEADVIAERRRQVEVEGWSPEHDDLHVDGEIGAAGVCYALSGTGWTHGLIRPLTSLWPWALTWWKPTDRRRDLVKAAALIIAEIERLDRATAHAPAGGETGDAG